MQDIKIYLDLIKAACTNTVDIQFRIDNNLATYIALRKLQGKASVGATTYATFDYTWKSPFQTDAGQTPGGYGSASSSLFSPGLRSSG